MPSVILVQVVYNNLKWIPLCFDAVFTQTYRDFKFVVVIAGNNDGGKEYISQHYPQVEIIDPGYNIGFAKGHNLVFEKYASSVKYFQLVNPDLIMEPDYVEKMVAAMEKEESIGAATGKLYQLVSTKIQAVNSKIIDTTGVVISKSGRARDRGQHEEDTGQYDILKEVDAVSAAGCMYRASALLAASYSLQARLEFFDPDFHSYWEDVDLAWRMKNAGWKNIFVPEAVAYHGRTAGSSKGGYKDVLGFIKHHNKLSPFVRQLNYKNHIFMYLKNSRWFYPQFFVREFFMLCYILLFETATLKAVPELIKNLPIMWKKRKILQYADR